MRAVAYQKSLPIENEQALVELSCRRRNLKGGTFWCRSKLSRSIPSTLRSAKEPVPDPSSGRCLDMTQPV